MKSFSDHFKNIFDFAKTLFKNESFWSIRAIHDWRQMIRPYPYPGFFDFVFIVVLSTISIAGIIPLVFFLSIELMVYIVLPTINVVTNITLFTGIMIAAPILAAGFFAVNAATEIIGLWSFALMEQYKSYNEHLNSDANSAEEYLYIKNIASVLAWPIVHLIAPLVNFVVIGIAAPFVLVGHVAVFMFEEEPRKQKPKSELKNPDISQSSVSEKENSTHKEPSRASYGSIFYPSLTNDANKTPSSAGTYSLASQDANPRI